jgi:hypothetical protein
LEKEKTTQHLITHIMTIYLSYFRENKKKKKKKKKKKGRREVSSVVKGGAIVLKE